MSSDLNSKKSVSTLTYIADTPKRDYVIETLLDDTFESVGSVTGLKTQLYPHQRVVVRAMIEFENNGQFKLQKSVTDNMCYDAAINAGILSEKVGSGKTFDILALIMLQPIPKGLGYNIQSILHKPIPERKNIGGLIIKKRFSYIYRPTLVFVGTSVLRQWADTIAKYTSLKTFVVLGIRELEVLMQMIEDKTVERFEVILIKNGTVVRPVLPNAIQLLKQNNISNPTIYGLIANIQCICWARVVIDDFDTIRLKDSSLTINANFTWYVSSTRKPMKFAASKNFDTTDYSTISDVLQYGNFPVGNITQNNILYYNRNVRSNPEFLEQSNQLCKPQFYAYKFKDPNIKLINIMHTLDDDMREVVEMINADAIETAAERLGIKTNSTAGIFEKILGDQYDSLILTCKILKFIEEQQANAGNRTEWIDVATHGTYGIRRLEKFEPITLNYPDIEQFLEEQVTKYTEQKNKAMNTLNRIKDHLTEGECPVCSQELKDDCEGKVVIFKCCSVIICEQCCFNTIFKRMHVGTCANCRTESNIKDLIYINQEIDLQDIIDQVDSGTFHKKIDDAANNMTENKLKEIKGSAYSKYDAIVDIIMGNTTPNRNTVNIVIPQLMSGSATLPEAPVRKTLIFANYDETLHRICDRLTDEKIEYERLGGTSKQIADIVERFQTNDTHNILVICAAKYCAGLNLQMATDLIFAHLMIDENVETQVAGRLIRLGRKYAANFHYLMYDSEYKIKMMRGKMHESE